jgi:hypothetical protein
MSLIIMSQARVEISELGKVKISSQCCASMEGTSDGEQHWHQMRLTPEWMDKSRARCSYNLLLIKPFHRLWIEGNQYDSIT